MFTGIVESMAKLVEIREEGTNKTFYFDSPLLPQLHVNQSLSHNGVCLTITVINDGLYSVTAVRETLIKSNLGDLKTGDYVNLERSMTSEYRFDGHIVQGHVDQTGVCTGVEPQDGSWLFDFSYDFNSAGNILVEKGSICVNGVSLTAFNCSQGGFRVTIIPYTWDNTNFRFIRKGDRVNLEFDVIGKYVQKMFLQVYQDHIKNKLN
jgi:riboflavin synthase